MRKLMPLYFLIAFTIAGCASTQCPPPQTNLTIEQTQKHAELLIKENSELKKELNYFLPPSTLTLKQAQEFTSLVLEDNKQLRAEIEQIKTEFRKPEEVFTAFGVGLFPILIWFLVILILGAILFRNRKFLKDHWVESIINITFKHFSMRNKFSKEANKIISEELKKEEKQLNRKISSKIENVLKKNAMTDQNIREVKHVIQLEQEESSKKINSLISLPIEKYLYIYKTIDMNLFEDIYKQHKEKGSYRDAFIDLRGKFTISAKKRLRKTINKYRDMEKLGLITKEKTKEIPPDKDIAIFDYT
ncbi:MAG: hypothetical protein ABIJ40_20970, partial [Bacteroidota bacterium]